MIKVLEVITDTNIGGAGVLLCSRLKHSDKNNFRYAVLLPKSSKLIRRLKDIDVEIFELDVAGDRSFDIAAVLKYLCVIKRFDPDIINAHGALSARIAAFALGIKIRIFTRHCAFETNKIYKARIVRLVVGRVSCLLSPHSIAVAEAAKRNLIEMGYSKHRIRVIINGVEGIRTVGQDEIDMLKKSLNIKCDDTVVCISARLVECKDHVTFLKAAKILVDTEENYKFLIIGAGELRRSLERIAHRLGIAEKVIFTGFVEDVAPYLSISDIQVNCSVGTETSSLALSEGMSIGLPSVASDFGGNPNMVKNGVNGYIYKMRDAHQLACMIKMIKNNGELYSRMSIAARERFHKEFNVQKTASETEEFYRLLYYKRNKK